MQLLSASALIILSAVVAFASFAMIDRPCCGVLIYSLVVLSAAAHFSIHSESLLPEETERVLERAADWNVGLIGVVRGIPEFRENARNGERIGFFTLECEGIAINGDWQRIHGKVDAHLFGLGADEAVQNGQRVLLHGKIQRKTFPGTRLYEVLVENGGEVDVLSGGHLSLLPFGSRLRDAGARRLERGMEQRPLQLSVLKALTLGYREQMPREVMDVFRRTGTFHIFAISGLHVGIVGLIFAIFLKAFGLPRDRFWMALIPMLALYVCSTGMKSSALRALMMAAVFLVSPVFSRKPDVPTSVAVAAIVLLLWNPFEIVSAGFIFSFSVVIFIVMVFSAVPEPWVRGGKVKSYVVSLAITSMAASMAAMPLTALYFGRFSPIAIVGNLLVVPLTFCIVLCGWLAMLAPLGAAVFNHAAVFFINLLLAGAQWLDRVPASSWQVAPPPLMAVLLWCGSCIYLFCHASMRRQRRYGYAAAGCALVLFLLG